MSSFSTHLVRNEFPQLARRIREKNLVYLDNAATTLKPKAVIDRLQRVYANEVANVHRGAHFLSAQATADFENAREKVQKFINAKHSCEIVFTRGTTESVNLVAQTYVRQHLRAGDTILLSELEHHSNIVPWQVVAKELGLKIVSIPLLQSGDFDLLAFERLLNPSVKFISVAWASNVLGSIFPVAEIAKRTHANGAKLMLDAAQAVSSLLVDVQIVDCDFLAFSGHKLFGPNGIGVLYAKQELLNSMPPYQTGGSMIDEVTFDHTSWAALPQKFEAGTPAIADAIGLGAAIDFFNGWDRTEVFAHEEKLVNMAREMLASIEGVQFFGSPSTKVSILPFALRDIHSADLASLLDQQGVAIRSGHHCCQPLMRKWGVSGTCRASFSIYNTEAEVHALVAAVKKAKEFF